MPTATPTSREPQLRNLDDDPATNRRLNDWLPAYTLETHVDAFLFRQVVDYSLRIEQALTEERALVAEEALRAEHGWDDARRLDAAQLGARLSRNPELTVLRLRQTKHGAEWLLARWTTLAAALKRGEPWTDRQRRLALDMAGTPADLRAPDDAIPDPAALAAHAIADLTALRDGPLATLDTYARQRSLAGDPLNPSRALLAARRRHAHFTRLFHATRKLLPARLPDKAPNHPQPIPQPTPTPSQPAPAPAPRPITTPTPSADHYPNRRARRAAAARAR